MGLLPLEVTGEWWLPTAPQRRTRGVLRFDPATGGEITVAPPLRGESAHGIGRYSYVHGHDGADAYTLIDCFTRRHSMVWGFATSAQETVRADRIVRGAHLDDERSLGGSALTVSVRHLLPWVNEATITETLEWNESPGAQKGRSIELKARQLPRRSASLDSGETLALEHWIGLSGNDLQGRTISQQFSLRVEAPDLRPLENLLAFVSDVQAVVTMAADAPAAITRVVLWHPGVRLSPGEEGEMLPIDVFARWMGADAEADSVDPDEMLFSFADLGQMEGLRRWTNAVAPHRGPLGRAVAPFLPRGCTCPTVYSIASQRSKASIGRAITTGCPSAGACFGRPMTLGRPSRNLSATLRRGHDWS